MVPLEQPLKKRKQESGSDRVRKRPHFAKATEGSTKRPQTAQETAAVRHHSKAASDPEGTESSTLSSAFKIVAGSYEKLLYGLEGSFSQEDEEESPKPRLDPIFIFPAHVSCLKALAASPGGKWLATGSTDEIIKVWDLRRRKEVGSLVQHEGSITYLGFPTRSHLVSAADDGNICIFSARDWALLRTLKGHKGRVNSVAIHPSGKVALSVGKDRTLRMWDFMRGKGAASTKLGKEAELVQWSHDGEKFVVVSQSTIDVYSTDMAITSTITHPSRIHDIKLCKRLDGDGELLLVAAEDKKVTIYDMESAQETSMTVIAEFIGHTNRVKSVDFISILNESTRKYTVLVCSASSDGKICLYDLSSLSSSDAGGSPVKFDPIAEYDTKGSRLTCCILADSQSSSAPPSNLTGKRRREESVDGS